MGNAEMTIAPHLARRFATLVATAGLLLSSTVRAQEVVYYHTDALGSVVAVTDANRTVIERNEYEPYGKVVNHALQDGPGYTGHVADAQTGLIYMQQRFYDDDLGGFPTVDPVTAYSVGGVFNRYGYANNNPYRFVDPDGRVPRGSLNLCSNGCSVFDGGSSAASSPAYTERVVTTGRGIATGLFGAAAGVLAATPEHDMFYNFGSTLYDDPTLADDFQAGHNFGYVLGFGALISGVKAGQKSSPAAQSARLLTFSERNLQKGFTKHGIDFGLSGNWNVGRGAEFRSAVLQHINSPGIRVINGSYRGQPGFIHYLNAKTRVNVVGDVSGNYVTGFRLGPNQLDDLVNKGNLW